MKKAILTLAMVVASILGASAQETVKTLYSGENREVTWAKTLSIGADQFADGVKVGDYLYITFARTSDVIEIKADGKVLPGSRFTWLGDNTADFKAYITKDMLAALKQYGLELCGANFIVSGVSVCNDGFDMPEGAIWGGYFWVDNWNTLEIFKTAFDNYDGEQFMDIHMSADNGDYTGYFMKVLTKWDPETVWANNDQIKHNSRIATIDLKGVDIAGTLKDTDRVMVQGNKEGGNPFNITAIVLRNDLSVDTEVITVASEHTVAPVFNLQGIRVGEMSQSEAQHTLPAGVYISNGRKFTVK